MNRRQSYFILLSMSTAFAMKAEASGVYALENAIQNIPPIDTSKKNDEKQKVVNYVFDEAMFQGNSLKGINLDFLNKTETYLPGTYHADILIDNKVVSRDKIEFIKNPSTEKVEPCFTYEYMENTLKIKTSSLKQTPSETCQFFSTLLPEASFEFNTAELKLNLAIPQSLIKKHPIGYIPLELLDSGEPMLFTNYDASAYQAKNHKNKYRYIYSSLSSGFNFGLWRFRNITNFSQSHANNKTKNNWKVIRTYVQRAIPSIKSEVTLGENYTSSSLFSGINFIGVKLETDQRMRPSSEMGYAPEVRGTANTTARVVIRQAGVIIKETTVAPGPFLINDLSGSSFSGDLEVEVIEANGVISTFTVPYSSVPESIRPGFSKYSIEAGKIDSFDLDKTYFTDITYQRGVSNAITANTGIRASEDYIALLAGGVLATEYGAFGLNGTYSNAVIENNQRKQGWRLGLTYSKTFDPTNTSISLAGYRYSSEGFRELLDAIGSRRNSTQYKNWDSQTLLQRNNFTISINQQLGEYGSLYISGSASDYYDGKSKNTQLQAGYANNWKDLTYNISWSRQNYLYNEQYLDRTAYIPLNSSNMSNVISLSFSLPLGSSRGSPRVNSMISQNNYNDHKTHQYQTGISGYLGDHRPVSYSVSGSHDDYSKNTSFVGSVNTNTPYANISANYSEGSDYSQFGASANGSLVVHSGGVTLGPRLGDTFALIEAKGAEGAYVNGYSGARVDPFGYALVGSLSPYRYNNIGLDPTDTNLNTELLETDISIAPYAGSSVKVKFKTLTGYPVLISSSLSDGTALPLGASAFNDENIDVGMVGQGGQVYARLQEGIGSLKVIWGEGPNEQCFINYTLDEPSNTKAHLIKMQLPCVTKNK